MGHLTQHGDLLSIEELAAYLGFSVGTIYKWNSKGCGPTRFKIGNRVFYKRIDVIAWIAQREVRQGGPL